MAEEARGQLLIIGGAEDKEDGALILHRFVDELRGGKLVVAPIATADPDDAWERYREVFKRLGVKKIERLRVRVRGDALDPARHEVLEGAAGVFFTGGDQLAITSQIGDTPVYRHVQDIFMKGGIIGGTSAGAAVMPDTMLVRGSSSESHKVGDYLRMAPGLGLLRDAVVDQHFSQRGRIVRLLAAIAQNPRVLGIGIDEDTAILVRDGAGFDVLGSGAVYVLDAGQVTYSNLTEAPAEEALSVFGVRLHVLSAGDCFDLHERRPMPGRIREPATEEEVGKSAAIDES